MGQISLSLVSFFGRPLKHFLIPFKSAEVLHKRSLPMLKNAHRFVKGNVIIFYLIAAFPCDFKVGRPLFRGQCHVLKNQVLNQALNLIIAQTQSNLIEPHSTVLMKQMCCTFVC